MKKNRFFLSAKSILLITLALLLVNGVVGAFLAYRARTTTRRVIDNHMLGVVKTAGATLNGDELAALTEEDVGGPKQIAVLDELNAFSSYLDFKYIYVVRAKDDGTYVFIADADPDDPAAFGEKVTESPALLSAGAGVAAVDDRAIADKWGNYYSAYCPVFTSDGKIGGIVGVDFDANWYKNQTTRNVIYVLLAGAVSLIAGSGIALLLTVRLRKRFLKLNDEVTALADNLGTLMDEISSDAGYAVIAPSSDPDGQETEGGVEKLSEDVATIRLNLKRYIDFAHAQAYVDGMTGAGNKTAYLELVHGIDKTIAEGDAAFSIAVFDVNGLKNVNDDCGHETGDGMLTGVAACIEAVFDKKNVFRIGGDEFIAVLPDYTETDMEEAFRKLDEHTARVNAANDGTDEATISFSKGAATFRPGEDTAFRSVFKRADEAMYRDKDAYYRDHGDLRRRS